jgi:hypothetical protein
MVVEALPTYLCEIQGVHQEIKRPSHGYKLFMLNGSLSHIQRPEGFYPRVHYAYPWGTAFEVIHPAPLKKELQKKY